MKFWLPITFRFLHVYIPNEYHAIICNCTYFICFRSPSYAIYIILVAFQTTILFLRFSILLLKLPNIGQAYIILTHLYCCNNIWRNLFCIPSQFNYWVIILWTIYQGCVSYISYVKNLYKTISSTCSYCISICRTRYIKNLIFICIEFYLNLLCLNIPSSTTSIYRRSYYFIKLARIPIKRSKWIIKLILLLFTWKYIIYVKFKLNFLIIFDLIQP